MFKVYICSVWPLCLSNINQYIWAEVLQTWADDQQGEEVPHLYGKPGGLSIEQVQVSYDDYWWLSYTFVWMFLTKSREVTSLCTSRIHSSKCHDKWKPFWLTIPCLSRPVAKTFEPKGQRHSGCPIATATRHQKYWYHLISILYLKQLVKKKTAKALLYDAILPPFSLYWLMS